MVTEGAIEKAYTNVTFTHSLRHASQLVEFRIDDLVGFFENANKIVGLLRVVRREECISGSCLVGSACAPDAMNIVFGAVGEIEVNDELDIIDICLQAKKSNVKILPHNIVTPCKEEAKKVKFLHRHA
jgi:hypothetical protein